MSTLKEVLTIVLPIFGLIYIGYIFRRFKFCTDQWVHVLNQFVYYVSLPAVITASFWQINIRDPKILSIVADNTIAVVIYAILLFVIIDVFAFKRGALKAAAFMVGIVGNTVYIGFPLLGMAFAKEYLPYGIAAATVHLVLGLIFSIMAVEYWVIKSKRPLSYFQDFVKNPFFISLGLGILLSYFNFSGSVAEVIRKPMTMLGSTASPLALFALGGFLHGKFIKHHLNRSIILTVVKIIVFPAFLWLVLWLIGCSPCFGAMSVIVASMPSAVTAFVIAEKYHLDHELVANTILLSTAVSVVTISIFLALFI